MPTNYEKVKAWRLANPDKVLEQAKRYRSKHPETNIRAKEKYRASNIEVIRERDREAKRKLRSVDPDGALRRRKAFEARREQERSRLAGRPRPDNCDICFEKAKIVFDHCHDKGHFRGWLCDRCNRTLGQVKDNPSLLRALAEYLERDHGNAYDKDQKGTTEV